MKDMIGKREKSKIYIAAVSLLLLFCVGFLCPVQVNAAEKKPVIKVNIKSDQEYDSVK